MPPLLLPGKVLYLHGVRVREAPFQCAAYILPSKVKAAFRPFVLVSILPDDHAAFFPLTSQARPERFPIPAEQQLGGTPNGVWGSRDLYLCDVANFVVGPISAFLSVANREDGNDRWVADDTIPHIRRVANLSASRRDRLKSLIL